ncbi:MAG: trimethylamine methyltransferase family protein [Candidatus Thorarchaeota archaeon]
MITVRFLTIEDIESVHRGSLEILEKTGVQVKNKDSLALLRTSGCEVEGQTVRFPTSIVEESIRKVPSSFHIYNREGDNEFIVGLTGVIYNPGSSAVYFKDRHSGEIRRGTESDCIELACLVDNLKYIKFQSTALVPSDVQQILSGLYRLYIILKHASKPIVTGAFRKEEVKSMKRLLESVVGGSDNLIEKPRAIFDCCPTSPLTWDDIACQHLMDCASSRIPATIVPAPLIGATSPATIQGTLIQSHVEILSGIVISQLTNPGSPIVYGGAPGTFDMKYGTPRFSSIESILTVCASSEIGKHYGFPTHAYLGTSDAKIEDSQSGFESGLGAILGALSGINVISGPGMLSQLNCQSLEKLVIDNEICGSAYRLIEGIAFEGIELLTDLIGKVGSGGHYLGEKHTLERFTSEHFIPSEVIDRSTGESWIQQGSKNSSVRAKEMVNSILEHQSPKYPESLDLLEQTFEQIKQKTISS